ncbi:OmpA family protein [Citreimonas salinaria]|uniref:Outer membrane protein OmpA n=1 Tax=Citreimonas salinaria TaxID=321339 RepID=A0A1H3LUN3_9RHOB|nr:OmpA family protein [Citreimonas salinaria]SDY67779.1 Outer membrane protein OmpA [Citreimonas salinaria]
MIRTSKTFILSLVAVVGIAGCTTGPLSDPNNPNSQAQQGALIGAVGGAIAGRAAGGSDVGERNRATVAGALVGAGVGAAIGNRLDRQEAELRAQLGNETAIRNTGERLIVTMPQDILFATDSAQLQPRLIGDLQTVAYSLRQYPDTTVQVIGHTDNTGSAAYNLDLSQRRARAVSSVLVSEGVSSGRIQTIGRGEDQPIASNLTTEGRAQNRRVEIVILPNA